MFLRDWRNRFDFFFRNRLTFSRAVTSELIVRQEIPKFQRELLEFLELFPWGPYLAPLGTGPLVALDVGAKNFALGPVVETFLESKGIASEIHGIEIDGFRRYPDFRSRADYGVFFAQMLKRGSYHCQDFRGWTMPAELIFLLNPFVALDPHERWGLPRKHFVPKALFAHAARLLRENGVVCLCSPNEAEWEIAQALAEGVGWKCVEEKTWVPTEYSVQTQKRIGGLFTKAT